jgi:hypothetical protein
MLHVIIFLIVAGWSSSLAFTLRGPLALFRKPMKMYKQIKPAHPAEPSRNDLLIFNTATGKKDVFKPLNSPKVTMYTCGPTVYDNAHVGNFRTFLVYDLLKRVLIYFGYDVDHVCNLTDIDDKIMDKVFKQEIHRKNVTDPFISAFHSDLRVHSSFCCF